MREPEFLPPWYSELLNRRRVLLVQGFSTALLCASLAAWALLGMRKIQGAQADLDGVSAQLARTGVDLQRLADLSAINEQLQRQNQIVGGLGADVPMSRMLTALEKLMPPQMALEEMQVQTEESVAAQSDADKAKGVSPTINRKLRLVLTGVAPSRDDLAMFLTDLVAVPYFSEVELVKADDASRNYRIMRHFEVKFAMSLDVDSPPRPASLASSDAEGDH